MILSHPFLSSSLHCTPLPGLQSLEITYGREAKKALGPIELGKHYVVTTKEEAPRLRSKKCRHHPQCPYCTIVHPYPWGDIPRPPLMPETSESTGPCICCFPTHTSMIKLN